MNKLLTGKVAIAAGSSLPVIASVVKTLLQQGATVIAPAKSAGEIATLKASLTGIDTGKLITLLSNYPDYDKVFEISESIIEQYGSIDIAIICFDAVTDAGQCSILETKIGDWEKMIDNNITAFFISARVVLGSMKHFNKGMFISVINSFDTENKNGAALATFTFCMQTEMAKVFFEEVKNYNVRCYHLTINNADKINDDNNAVEEKTHDDNAVGNFIMQLYNGKCNHAESLFQSFTINRWNNKAALL